MNISYYEFSNLPDDIQFTLVQNHGRIIYENTVGSSRYILYELSSFSVEIIYNLTKNKIAGKNLYLNRGAYAV